nr:diptericin A [Drosophila micromelanica]
MQFFNHRSARLPSRLRFGHAPAVSGGASSPEQRHRERVETSAKQFNPPNEQRLLVDGGYNEDKSGKDVWAQAQAPVWTSDNKRHEIDVVGRYGQHLGGPWGNSEPSYGVGGNYRFRF